MRVFSTRSFWFPVLVVTLVAALLGSALGRQGRQLRCALAERAALEAKLASLKATNGELRAQRDALLCSPEAAERVAREEYGFAAPGERVEKFQPPAGTVDRRAPLRISVSPWERVLMWRELPRVMPAAVFVVTALVFGVANAVAASRLKKRPRGSAGQ